MGLFEDDDEPDPPPRPLLPPEDRIWRHPSELAARSAGRTPRRGVRMFGVAAIGGALGATLTTGALAAAGIFDREPPPERVFERVVPVTLTIPTTSPDAVDVARRVLGSVVRVEARSDAGTATASAVTYDNAGHLLTNAHALSGATSIRVILAGERSVAAEVVGSDDMTDIAVLRIAASGLRPVTLGTSADLRVGQELVAVGSPLGLVGQPSVSTGVFSGTRPRVEAADGRVHYGMLQSDVPIAPGSSGGGLFNSDAELIGLTTALAVDRDTPTTSLTLAVPIELAGQVADQLITSGHATHPWIGLTGAVQSGDGAVIHEVATDSPADQAGLRVNDVVTELDRTPIRSGADLVMALRTHAPGETVEVEYRRNDETRTCSVLVVARPGPDDQ